MSLSYSEVTHLPRTALKNGWPSSLGLFDLAAAADVLVAQDMGDAPDFGHEGAVVVVV
jgi:hypothetical protein